jgi:hypothetical protein
MDILQIIKANNDFHNQVLHFCDIELYLNEKDPENMNGTMVFNINGKAFGQDASGGEYIFLEDNSIGLSGSEGEVGRIAENIDELFELLINCPYWRDCLYSGLYENEIILQKYIKIAEQNYEKTFLKNGMTYKIMQKELSDELSIKIYDDKSMVLKRFYKSALRNPQYISTYTAEDGMEYKTEGSLIEMEMPPFIKEILKNDLKKMQGTGVLRIAELFTLRGLRPRSVNNG